jgi:uncharacterized protein
LIAVLGGDFMGEESRFDGRFAAGNSSLPAANSGEHDSRTKRDAIASCGIAMMAKASAPGRTKTRLVPPLTHEQAAALNTAFLRDIASNVLAACEHASIAGYAAYAPNGSESFFSDALPPAIGLIEASLPTLGDCLAHTIAQIFAKGHAAAVVLNSDSPTLPTALLLETALVLALPGDRAVLGPAVDGGYYLLGLKALHRRLLEDIAWSTERVAAQTLERAREINLDVHILSAWYDVDDAESLGRLRAEVGKLRPPLRLPDRHGAYYPAATAALLQSIWPDLDRGRRDYTGQAAIHDVPAAE